MLRRVKGDSRCGSGERRPHHGYLTFAKYNLLHLREIEEFDARYGRKIITVVILDGKIDRIEYGDFKSEKTEIT